MMQPDLDNLVSLVSLASLVTRVTLVTLACLVYFERIFTFLSFAFSIVRGLGVYLFSVNKIILSSHYY